MSFWGQRRFFAQACAGLIISLGAAATAHAQIHHIDYTNMNQQISPQGAANYYMDPSSISSQLNSNMQKFIGKAPNTDKFMALNHATLTKGNLTMENSPLNGKMSNSPLWQKAYANPGNLTQKSYPQTDPRNPQMDTALQRDSRYNSSTEYDQLKPHQSGPSKYADSFVFHTQDNNQPLVDVGRELSLQDINRYQFQGSHSGEPGLPLTHAGTSSEPSLVGSPLASGPATFDGNALQGGRVLSGTSNQMRLITPNGSRPYQPMQLDSSNSASLSNGSSSGSRPQNPGYDTVYSQAQSLRSSKSSSDLKGAAFMPSGNYSPVTPNGNAVPMSFDTPQMIISVKKGGFVGMGDGNTATGPTSQSQ